MWSKISKAVVFTAIALSLSGCIHQEFMFPGSGNSLWSFGEENATVDVSDLNATVQEEQAIPRIPFPVEEYRRLPRSGSSTIQGNISVDDASGRKIYGRQTRLYLNPVTSYSRQWYEESYINGQKMAKADPRLFNYLKFTTSDKNGHFAFYGVPAGRYYVIGVVRCAQECGYDIPRNIRVAREVAVGRSSSVTVELNKMIQ
jgi:hypothetical protein